MEKLDITKQPLYITQKINVFKKQNTRNRKLLPCGSRHSDAFIFFLEGSCSYIMEGDTDFSLTVKTGEILYLAKNASYTMFIHSDTIRFIYVDFEFASEEKRRCEVYHIQNPAAAQSLFEKLYQLEKRTDGSSFAESMAVLYEIYGTVLATAGRPYLGKNTKQKIEDAKAFADAHFKNADVGVAELAQMADMSEVHFRKLFKAQFGLSPIRYIAALRLENAKQMLRYPFFSMEDCALQSGFTSLPYFCRVFKKSTGFGFSEYLTLYRLKQAEILLLEESTKSVSEIAYSCGFNDSNYFANRFKKIYGITPSKLRHEPPESKRQKIAIP